MENLARLARGGITLHTQIVLMPGINDGPHLEKSIFDLLTYFPALQTVAVVPVGLTDHRQGLKPLTPVDAAYARKTIATVHGYQRQIRKLHGTPFCYLGDEFYILAGHRIPGRSHYGEFPIIENGVGMVRRFLDGHRGAMRRKWKLPGREVRGTVVTGKIFFPILETCIDDMNHQFGLNLHCVLAPSLFLGKAITVAGLLAGQDIYEAVRNRMQGDFLVVPSEAMIHEEGLFLDNWERKDLEKRLGVPVLGGGHSAGEFLELVLSQGKPVSPCLRPPDGR
jgi:putative radical SAM enzyme (TIGR03279 family)